MQAWGCSRARDIFGTPGPSPEKTTCSFSYRFKGAIWDFGGCTRQSGSQPKNLSLCKNLLLQNPGKIRLLRRKAWEFKIQPAPKYHTKGCSRSSADSPGARTLVFVAFEPFSSCEFRASIARTPFCAILWRSPKNSRTVR